MSDGTPRVSLTLAGLPIAAAFKLPRRLHRLVDFVREEIRRDKKLREAAENAEAFEAVEDFVTSARRGGR